MAPHAKPEALPTAPAAAGAEGPAASSPCRFCGVGDLELVVDLGSSPLANSYLEAADLEGPEVFYPLCVRVCPKCFLVQLPEVTSPESIFTHYSYFSSYSESWLRHAETYAVATIDRFGLGASHRVVEAASNDGYLLRFFRQRDIPVLGIEPAGNVAEAARAIGVATEVRFFGRDTASDLVARGLAADLFVANNVLAHTPHLNDFVAGIAILLRPEGVATLEFPHLLRLLEETQFDTIYHEHFSYFSLRAVERVFAAHGLEIFDVESLRTHGGSLRIYAQRLGAGQASTARLAALRAEEDRAGIEDLACYRAFATRVLETKRRLLEYLIAAKRAGLSVAAYGAPAKGNTLLNYCGVRTDFLDYTVDLSPHKQGRYLPGTRVPIHSPERLRATRPDRILILPWNLRDEIARQLADVRAWGARFVVAIPTVEEF